MSCHATANVIPDWLTGELDEATRAQVEAHLAECGSCRSELEGLSETWTRLRILPDELPSPALRGAFYAALEAELSAGRVEPRARAVAISTALGTGRLGGWRAPLAAAALLALGVALGVRIGGGKPGPAQTTTELDARRLMAQAAAGERIKGVALVSQVAQPDPELLTTLLRVIDDDPNVNVRLSAIEAIYLFAGHPHVREELTHALAVQSSPVVQIALIDLLVAIREKRATEALNSLVQDQRVRPEVRQHARSGIEKLL